MDEEIAKAGSVHIYMDAREQTGISTPERERLAAWAKRQGDKYPAGHLLFRSRLIELAVAIVNMVTGGTVKSYSNVEQFEAAIRANIPGFRKLPSFDGKVPPKKTA